MTTAHDPVHLFKRANPVPSPPSTGVRDDALARAAVERILAMDHGENRRQPRRRTALVLAAGLLVLGATAAWAYTVGGMFPAPAFSGETWKLTVGEEANGDLGTFKVCHVFERRVGANMGNGYGVSSCGDWPAAGADRAAAGSAFIDVVPALSTPEQVVLFIDLTPKPVATVVVKSDVGAVVEVNPYRMPQTGKQYAVAELPAKARTAVVRLLDSNGQELERRRVPDLTVGPVDP